MKELERPIYAPRISKFAARTQFCPVTWDVAGDHHQHRCRKHPGHIAPNAQRKIVHICRCGAYNARTT